MIKERTWKIPEIKKKGEEDVPHPFEGEVTLKIPKYLDLVNRSKDLHFTPGEEGQVKVNEGLKVVEGLMLIAKDHILSMKVKIKKTGEEITNPEDLEYSPQGVNLLQEIGGHLLEGISPGEA